MPGPEFCHWVGSPPFCAGECSGGEIDYQDAPQLVAGFPGNFPGICWAGTEAYCCRTDGTQVSQGSATIEINFAMLGACTASPASVSLSYQDSSDPNISGKQTALSSSQQTDLNGWLVNACVYSFPNIAGVGFGANTQWTIGFSEGTKISATTNATFSVNAANMAVYCSSDADMSDLKCQLNAYP
jgi:hypothetical protein